VSSWLSSTASSQRAKATTAYAAAITYLAAERPVSEDSWDVARAYLWLEITGMRVPHGALAEAEQRLAALSNRAANTVERATVACLRVDLYTTLDQSSRAIAVGLDYLGISVSTGRPTDGRGNATRIRADLSQLGSRMIEDLIELPLMSDLHPSRRWTF